MNPQYIISSAGSFWKLQDVQGNPFYRETKQITYAEALQLCGKGMPTTVVGFGVYRTDVSPVEIIGVASSMNEAQRLALEDESKIVNEHEPTLVLNLITDTDKGETDVDTDYA